VNTDGPLKASIASGIFEDEVIISNIEVGWQDRV
jgi:hypothetical protein